jgi:hypothetical protein
LLDNKSSEDISKSSSDLSINEGIKGTSLNVEDGSANLRYPNGDKN